MTTGFNVREGSRMIADRIALLGRAETEPSESGLGRHAHGLPPAEQAVPLDDPPPGLLAPDRSAA